MAIVSHRRRLIAHCNCSAILPPIALPFLPIAAAANHCDHTAAFHFDHHCRPSCVASNCAASASATIVCHPLCRPLCHCCPIAHRNRFTVPSPIVQPLFPAATAAVHCYLTSGVHLDHCCCPSCIASHCAASALGVILRCPPWHTCCHHCH